MDGSRFDAIVGNAARLTRRATLGSLLAAFAAARSASAQVQTELCLPNGQRCGKKAGGRGRPCRKCCSKHAPKENGARHCACVPFGGKCGNSGHCCEGDCIRGTCGCRDDGETCANDAECCFSSCIDGICQCLDDGAACDDSLDCCFSNCVLGVCQCLDDGEACTDDFDCCESDCVQGLCQCLEDGEACADDFECCDLACANGVCGCLPGGAACEDDFDCCETACTGGVCVNPVCVAEREVCNGRPEPNQPFCGFSLCICLETTSGEPFCGDFFNSPEECSGCSLDSECETVTGSGSACVVAGECCDLEGSGTASLCMPPCPEPESQPRTRHGDQHGRRRAGAPGPQRKLRPRREKKRRR